MGGHRSAPTTPREPFRTPGPGAYSPEKPVLKPVPNVGFAKGSRNANIFISRQHSQAVKNNVGPGPAYDVTRDVRTNKLMGVEPSPEDILKETKAIKFAGRLWSADNVPREKLVTSKMRPGVSIAQSTRSAEAKKLTTYEKITTCEHSPGAIYPVPTRTMKGGTMFGGKTNGLKWAKPPAQKTPRERSDYVPGPGAYDVGFDVVEINGPSVSIGSSTRPAPYSNIKTPAPATYQGGLIRSAPSTPRAAVFGSATRDQQQRKIYLGAQFKAGSLGEASPGPAAPYSPRYLSDQNITWSSGFASANRFSSGAEYMGACQTFVEDEGRWRKDVPQLGPGTYTPRDETIRSRVKGGIMTISQREKVTKGLAVTTPGPASYSPRVPQSFSTKVGATFSGAPTPKKPKDHPVPGPGYYPGALKIDLVSTPERIPTFSKTNHNPKVFLRHKPLKENCGPGPIYDPQFLSEYRVQTANLGMSGGRAFPPKQREQMSVPGPGAYPGAGDSVERTSKIRHHEGPSFGFSKRKFTFIKNEVETGLVPGPGHYSQTTPRGNWSKGGYHFGSSQRHDFTLA